MKITDYDYAINVFMSRTGYGIENEAHSVLEPYIKDFDIDEDAYIVDNVRNVAEYVQDWENCNTEEDDEETAKNERGHRYTEVTWLDPTSAWVVEGQNEFDYAASCAEYIMDSLDDDFWESYINEQTASNSERRTGSKLRKDDPAEFETAKEDAREELAEQLSDELSNMDWGDTLRVCDTHGTDGSITYEGPEITCVRRWQE